jgi:hypothetical protein
MSPRDWIRLAERKEKEAKKLLIEAKAFRRMAGQDRAGLTLEKVTQIIRDYTCAGYADDKVLGVEKAAETIILASQQ